jgi:hypothetical protein
MKCSDRRSHIREGRGGEGEATPTSSTSGSKKEEGGECSVGLLLPAQLRPVLLAS